MNEWFIVALIAIYFIAGMIKATFGIGFPTAAIALTATLIDARSAIGYVIIPLCLNNVWHIYRSGHLLQVLVRNWPLVASIGLFSLQIAAEKFQKLVLMILLLLGLNIIRRALMM